VINAKRALPTQHPQMHRPRMQRSSDRILPAVARFQPPVEPSTIRPTMANAKRPSNAAPSEAHTTHAKKQRPNSARCKEISTSNRVVYSSTDTGDARQLEPRKRPIAVDPADNANQGKNTDQILPAAARFQIPIA
jgi:hypothetical protein